MKKFSFSFMVSMVLLLLTVTCVQAETKKNNNKFSESAFPGWKEIFFEGETSYTLTDECVLASSHKSASGLISEKRVAIDRSTTLKWSWKANAMMTGNNFPEKTKQGDDFLVRVYVIHEGRFFWQTKALNYVWSRDQKVGEHWPNPFTSNAHMIVVQSGSEQLGEWQSFERNIKQDFKTYLDMDVDRIDAIALMSDTDNSGGKAEACYKLPELMELNQE